MFNHVHFPNKEQRENIIIYIMFTQCFFFFLRIIYMFNLPCPIYTLLYSSVPLLDMIHLHSPRNEDYQHIELQPTAIFSKI